jgi:hypothetical protein
VLDGSSLLRGHPALSDSSLQSDDRGHVRVSACNEPASSREIEEELGVWVFQARALSVGLEDFK